jgi:hypothetical protein
VIRLEGAKNLSPIEMQLQWIEQCGNESWECSISKNDTELENCGTHIHDDLHTVRPGVPRTDVNAACVKKPMLENRLVTMRDLSDVLKLSFGRTYTISSIKHRDIAKLVHAGYYNNWHTSTKFDVSISLFYIFNGFERKETSFWNPLWEGKGYGCIVSQVKTNLCAAETQHQKCISPLGKLWVAGAIHVELMPRSTTVNANAYCGRLRRLRETICGQNRGRLSWGAILPYEPASLISGTKCC